MPSRLAPFFRTFQRGPGPRARRACQVLLVLLMAVVCALAFAPHPPPALDTGWDKRNHLLAFASLALVAELAFWPAARRRAKVLLGLLAFGGFIELVQSQIPERSAEWVDLLADGLGIALGLALVAALVRLSRGRPGTQSR
ncbi:MAG: VanZ family protein [Rubrivivax sp.]